MTRLRRLKWGGLLWMLAVAGCTLDPDYQRPASPIAAQWPTAGTDAGHVAPADIGWRDFFADEKLRSLIALALENNRDLRVAALNVAEAQARYRVQRADLFPTIDATATGQVERYPTGVIASSSGGGAASAAGGASAGSSGSSSGASSGYITRYYDVGVGFTSYEIDLFGRIRSLDRAALEQYLSADETRRAMQLTLIGEVASGYFSVLADDALLNLTRSTLEAQQASYDITKKNFDFGNDTELSVRQAESTVDTARANLVSEQLQLAQDQDSLVLLLGAAIPPDLTPASNLIDEKLDTDLPAGIPSTVLVSRPDILESEHQLLAANADIGAARAAFFPSISLTGNFGTAASQLTGLFAGGSKAWSFAPQITLPIFTGGANEANLDLAKLEKDVAVAQYEKAIQTGFREVSDALVARQSYEDQLSAQMALVDATGKALALATLRYKNGVDNYLSVLDSQRSLYSAQQSLVSVRLARLQNLATLYKVLGGGTKEHTEIAASPQK